MAIELDDGTIIRSLPEQVTKNKEDVEDLQDGLTALEQQVASALAGVFHYKGSVATYGDLPSSGNEVGDVYNVNDTGKNYAWSGSAWDDLGGIVDLSNLVTLNTSQTITGYKTFQSQLDVINGIGVGQGGVITDLQGGIRFSEYNGVGLDYENAALFPAITNTVDLGSSTNNFKDLYLADKIFCNNVNNYLNFSNSSLIDIFIGGTLKHRFAASAEYITTTLLPTLNVDLGSPTNQWKDFHFSGNLITYNTNGFHINISGTNRYRFTPTIFYPTTANYSDLGSSYYKWKNLHLAGNITDGTNSASVADIAAQKEATGGTLRQVLALKETLNFEDTGFVDLGNATYYLSSNNRAYCYLLNNVAENPSSNTVIAKLICSKFSTKTYDDFQNSIGNETIALSGTGTLGIISSSFAGKTEAEIKELLNGVLVAYKKA